MQRSLTARPLTMGPTGIPETSVTNYHSTLRNIAEERRPQTVANLGLTSGHTEIQPQKVTVVRTEFCVSFQCRYMS
jgi:pyrrolidone-carboxylate peptidase